MNTGDFTTTFVVDQTPEEVFAAINDVRAWWPGEFEGNTTKLGYEFTYRYEDVHYSKQKITVSIPGKKVVWRVVDAKLNFTQDKGEWKGTDITFDISRKGDKTEMRFTHVGLVPEFECFNECSNAWGSIINHNLQGRIRGDLVTTGMRQPDEHEQ